MIYTDTSISQARTESAPPNTKHGVVYTKSWVVELMLDLAGYTADLDLASCFAIEPAAGDGSFLIPMAQRLIESAHRHGRDLAKTSLPLLAIELDSSSSTRARRLLGSLLRTNGYDDATSKVLASSWVQTGDFLLDAPALPPTDFVIGNPPYIRLEEINPEIVQDYRRQYSTMTGRADLYVAFFEAALKQLKSNGVCAFICADRWMLNQYGAELRRLVTNAFSVEAVIELHRANAFEDNVSAYPAITVIRRASQGVAVVARGGAGIETLDSKHIQSTLSAARETGNQVVGSDPLRAASVQQWFEGADPWPCYSPERLALLKHLEAEFYPLESAGTGTRVSIGVATGADDIFLTTDSNLVERDRLLPLAMASDIRSGHLQWSETFLINPWNGQGLVDLSKYPQLAEYLRSHETQLRGRHVGKKSADRWYRTIDRVDQELTNKAKLYIADIKDRLNPVLDAGETYPHHNLYFIQSAGWDLEVLGGLLLSSVAQLFVESYGVRMRGGYLRFQAQYLRRIRVPRPHDISTQDASDLREAFRKRDRDAASSIAMKIYGIHDFEEMSH